MRSFDDQRLKTLTIGIQITGDDYDNPPAALSDRSTQIRPDAARAIIEDVLAIRAALPPI